MLLHSLLQCAGYTDGEVAGSLCKPLCETKEINITKCIGGHGVKPLVLVAERKAKPVIIKSVRPYLLHSERIRYLRNLRPLGYDPSKLDIPEYVNEFAKLTRGQFIKQANATLYYGIGGGRISQYTERVLKQVVSECDLHGDGLLERDELIRCWQIVESEEYMIASLLAGSSAVPKVYGVCGELYAEEYVAPLQLKGFMTFLDNQRSWKTRATIALAILDLLVAIENTPYGTLHLCDVKAANIGVIQDNGRYIAKAIDLDSGWFGESMRMVKFQRLVLGQKCKSDVECDFLKCHFACNIASHTCTDKVISSNFQVRVPSCWPSSENSTLALRQPSFFMQLLQALAIVH